VVKTTADRDTERLTKVGKTKARIDTRIIYLLPIPRSEPADTSPFQGFNPGLLERLHVLVVLRRLPPDILELYWPKLACLAKRASGITSFSGLPIIVDVLPDMSPSVHQPFIVIFSDRSLFLRVKTWCEGQPIPILHVSTVKSPDTCLLSHLDSRKIHNHVRRVLQYIASNDPSLDLSAFQKISKKFRQWPLEQLSISRHNHYCVEPNQFVLDSIGFDFPGSRHLVSTENTPYFTAIRESTEAVLAQRRRVSSHRSFRAFPPMPSLIVTAPSIYKHMYRLKLGPNRTDTESDAIIRGVISDFQKQENYSMIHSNESRLRAMLNSPEGRSLLKLRQRELAAYTIALSLRSASHISGTVRLPPRINRLRGDMKQIASCARGQSQRQREKLNRLAYDFTSKLEEATGPELLPLIDRHHTGVKLVADIPLEWTPIRGLPIMLRQEVSRITTTPGDLMFQQLVPQNQLFVTPEDLPNILVIRSFKTSDKRRSLLEEAVTTNSKNSKNHLKIKYIDVASEEDVLKALEEFHGAIMIFDGHGEHAEREDIGVLWVGNERLVPWNLRGKTRIPPIVILSACDTQSLDGSHVTIANGFLNCGARTVLGTALPVHAAEAAIFVGRLILRLIEFVPLLTGNNGRALRWSEIVSGLQKMLFSTELIFGVQKKIGTISSQVFHRLQMKANMLINADEDPEWYEKFVAFVSETCEFAETAVLEVVKNSLALPECLKHVQMGNPETVIIPWQGLPY
jgi:hypothetical protein